MLKLDLQANGATVELIRNPTTSALMIVKNGQRCWVHVPPDAASAGPLPCLLVMHGAGKGRFWNLEEQAASFAEQAREHKVIVVYPETRGGTWDYISTRRAARADFDFVQMCLRTVRKAYRVDRTAVMGISDGGSMALSLAVHNPGIFEAAISVSAGFAEPPRTSAGASPKLFMVHGSHDPMFPLERVGEPLREKLVKLGYRVEHRVAQGQGHAPDGWRGMFLPEWLRMGATCNERG